MKDELISLAAFFTTTDADDPDLSVLLLLLVPLVWPFRTALLEPTLEDNFPTIFDDPFTSFDVLEAVMLAPAVAADGSESNLGLFSAGDVSLVLSLLPFV